MGSRDADVLICPTRFFDPLSAPKGLAFGAHDRPLISVQEGRAALTPSSVPKYACGTSLSISAFFECFLNRSAQFCILAYSGSS